MTIKNKIRAFKVQGGQEVVAEVVGTTEFCGSTISIKMKRPHILQFQQQRDGSVGLVFIPWTLSNPDIRELDVPISAILFSFETSAQVEKQYLQQTSGIEIATAM